MFFIGFLWQSYNRIFIPTNFLASFFMVRLIANMTRKELIFSQKCKELTEAEDSK